MTLVLNNAQVFRNGVFSRSSVSISLGNGVSRGGTISTMDASSFVILPGFVDVHVHLREPGFSYKETIRTGSLAAAHERRAGRGTGGLGRHGPLCGGLLR